MQDKVNFCYFRCDLQNIEYNFTRYNLDYVISFFHFNVDITESFIKNNIRQSDTYIKIAEKDYVILFFNVDKKSAILPILAFEKKMLGKYLLLDSKDIFNVVYCNRSEKQDLRQALKRCSKIIKNKTLFDRDNIIYFEKK